jgi:hypothetical protein
MQGKKISDSEQEQLVKISKAEFELAAFYKSRLKNNSLTMAEAAIILSKQTTKAISHVCESTSDN